MVFVSSPDGTDIAVHDLGGDDNAGPPILFAHANGFHGRLWAPISRRLNARNRRFSFDFAGHGHSRTPDDHDYDWHGFADDVLAVIDGLGLDRPIGIGHSLGGASSVLAEAKRPGTFRALYLFEPIISPVTDAVEREGVPQAEGARRRREVFASRDEAFDNYAGKPPFNAITPEALRAYVDDGFEDLPDGTVRLRCRRETEASVFSMSMEHGAFAHLGRLALPVVVAAGRNDGSGPAAWAPAVAAAIVGAVFEPHPDLGHLGPMEDPDKMAAAIDRFIAGVNDHFIHDRVTPSA